MSREGKYLLLTLSAVVLVLLLAEPVPVKIPVVIPVVEAGRDAVVLPKITLVPAGEELRLNPEAMLRKRTVLPPAVNVQPLVDFHTLGLQCSIDW